MALTYHITRRCGKTDVFWWPLCGVKEMHDQPLVGGIPLWWPYRNEEEARAEFKNLKEKDPEDVYKLVITNLQTKTQIRET